MSTMENKAAMLRPAEKSGADLASANCLHFDVTAVSQAHPLPDAWADGFCHLKADGGVCYYFITVAETATLAGTAAIPAAAAAGGAAATNCWPISDGATEPVLLRPITGAEKNWLVRIGTGTYSVWARKA